MTNFTQTYYLSHVREPTNFETLPLKHDSLSPKETLQGLGLCLHQVKKNPPQQTTTEGPLKATKLLHGIVVTIVIAFVAIAVVVVECRVL